MARPLPRLVFRTLRIAGIVTGSLILLLFLLPYIFPGFVSNKIRAWAKSTVRSELTFSSARLSFFRHFPALTLTLYDFRLKGSAPFENETLIEADEAALGVDLTSVFSTLKIDKMFLTHGNINIQVDSSGKANYNVYASKTAANSSPDADSSDASLKIKKIVINNSRLVYNDRSIPILIDMKDIDYRGSGDLSQALFDLTTHMEVASMDLYYDKQAYFVNKKIDADLVTRINTSSFGLLFQKNRIMINQLPVDFTGRFEFLKDGYDMDFQVHSADAALRDIFTALPPGALSWLSRMEIKGYGDLDASLTGRYISAAGIMPDLNLDLRIKDGYISNPQAPAPLSHLQLSFRSRIPGLNPDSISANIDSIRFNVDKDYFIASLQLKGLSQPWINGRVRAHLDLDKWNKAMGISGIELKGIWDLQANAEGHYRTRVVRSASLRKIAYDTIISSIPQFTLNSRFTNGYFKYASYPEGIKDIAFRLDASCPDSNYNHMRLDLHDLNAAVLGNYLKGFIKLEGLGDLNVDANLESLFHLSDIKKVMPLDSMDLEGDLNMRLQSYGAYKPARKLFPITVANIQLSNGSVKTKYYPHPLENIQVSAKISNTAGSLKALQVQIAPLSFRFEGQPFMLKADLKDFHDLRYDIVSKGLVDIGKMYKVFAVKGYDIDGLVQTDLTLRGRHSDAASGRYERLYNAGTLNVKDLHISTELFPMPFHIAKGLFRFDQDKMWFDHFDFRYGKTAASLNGWLSNAYACMTDPGLPIKGHFDLTSDYLLVDEFMAFANGTTSTAQPTSLSQPGATPNQPGAAPNQPPSSPSGAAPTGVILVPAGLSLDFNASVKKARYNGIDLDSLTGRMSIDSGIIRLDTTRFVLIGAPVEMNASYKSLTPQKASFDYRIRAKDFDVQRAYREIKIFHDMAASAAKAQGLISLDYQLAGKLDGSMSPVYPSLKGGGTLSISKVKLKGLRLFSAVSKETNKDVSDPDLSKVDFKSTINNNIITLSRTRMKISAFRLRMEGQATLDGRLNLQMRIGLPPFGLIGIPIKVTGTQDNPKVHTGRSKKGDQLEETEDKDEEEQHPAQTSEHITRPITRTPL